MYRTNGWQPHCTKVLFPAFDAMRFPSQLHECTKRSRSKMLHKKRNRQRAAPSCTTFLSDGCLKANRKLRRDIRSSDLNYGDLLCACTRFAYLSTPQLSFPAKWDDFPARQCVLWSSTYEKKSSTGRTTKRSFSQLLRVLYGSQPTNPCPCWSLVLHSTAKFIQAPNPCHPRALFPSEHFPLMHLKSTSVFLRLWIPAHCWHVLSDVQTSSYQMFPHSGMGLLCSNLLSLSNIDILPISSFGATAVL